MNNKYLKTLGIFSALLYLTSTAIIGYILYGAIAYAFSFINKNANFQMFNISTYFELYFKYAYSILVFISLLVLSLALLFNFLRNKLNTFKMCLVFIIWDVMNYILYGLIPADIYSRIDNIPFSETTNKGVLIENMSLQYYKPHIWLFFSTLLVIVLCVVVAKRIINKNKLLTSEIKTIDK